MRKCEVTGKMKMSKKLRSNLITYGIVIAAFLLCQLALSPSIVGLMRNSLSEAPHTQ